MVCNVSCNLTYEFLSLQIESNTYQLFFFCQKQALRRSPYCFTSRQYLNLTPDPPRTRLSCGVTFLQSFVESFLRWNSVLLSVLTFSLFRSPSIVEKKMSYNQNQENTLRINTMYPVFIKGHSFKLSKPFTTST